MLLVSIAPLAAVRVASEVTDELWGFPVVVLTLCVILFS
jgi:hypothetical protein